VLFGMVLTVAQESVLSRTWTSCEWGYGPPGDSFPDDGAYLDIFAIVLRLPAYVVASLIGAYVGRRWISRAGWAGAVLRILTIVAVCAVVFVGDFAWGVKMNAGDYNPAHCPGGVPTWWPF
jgi:hypothetical protein